MNGASDDLIMAVLERYQVPRTLESLARTLGEGEATILAGGTDLMPQTQAGARQFRTTLVNIRRIDDLAVIDDSGGMIRIGALTTITEILESRLLRDEASVLVQAADQFASGQIRNMATLGGNLCNASPAGDMIVPLLLLDAEVELTSWTDGQLTRRTVALDEFFLGPGRTQLRPGEVLTSVQFPAPERGAVGLFRKLGARPALDISVVSVGIFGVRDDGRWRRVRAAFGAVAPTPIRGRRTEAALEGCALDAETITAGASAAVDDATPISDVRASAWYRQQTLRCLTERTLHEVAGVKS